MSNKKYTGRIQELNKQCEADWGNPEENVKHLVPLGLGVIDAAIWGLNMIDGDLILIIGEEKNRKSTLLYNILINIMMNKLPETKPKVCFDTLEPGVPPKRVRDLLLCNVATRLLLEIGHKQAGACSICGGSKCKQIGLSPEVLRFRKLTDEQNAVISAARMETNKWPLRIYGPAEEEGQTKNIQKANQRWRELVDEGCQIIMSDHLQQYDIPGNEYERQAQALGFINVLVAEMKIAFLAVSQVSLTSIREAKQGIGVLDATGGRKAAQDCNIEFTVHYHPSIQSIEVEITRTRRSGQTQAMIPIERESGAIIGVPTTPKKK